MSIQEKRIRKLLSHLDLASDKNLDFVVLHLLALYETDKPLTFKKKQPVELSVEEMAGRGHN